MTNLLNETEHAIRLSGHTPEDLVFIGSLISGHSCSWEEFRTLANIEYDESFGAAEVAEDLVLVFSDGQQLWRGEYDGSEWWEYAIPAEIPTNQHPIKRLTVVGTDAVGWRSLKELQDE